MDTRSCAAIALLLSGFPSVIFGAETLGEAIRETHASVNWRLRYEGVDETGFTEQANAVTSRMRAGLKTGEWGKTSFLGEIVWTEEIVSDFNSTVNGKTEFPVVPDPGGFAAINRLAIVNKSLESTALTLGRQRIVLDDSRFVGNVGWRQNEQTYDGLRAQIDRNAASIDLAYITQVNRVFGPDSPSGTWNGDILLGNVARVFAWGKLTGFAYHLDVDEAAALSTDTLGLRLSGKKPLPAISVIYTLSLARQTDAGRNPADFSADYYFLESGLKIDRITVALGFELLGGDGTNRFTTPLATLHAFQGWADKFLNTPADGIADRFLRVAYGSGGVGPFTRLGVDAVYHGFDADRGSAHYGNELDVSLVARTQRLALTLKYATYRADALLTDTDKLWLSMDYAF